jgi:hypothetical protein
MVNVVALSVFMLKVLKRSVIMLNVVMLSVILLKVMAPKKHLIIVKRFLSFHVFWSGTILPKDI